MEDPRYFTVGDERVRLLLDGKQSLVAMLGAIASAKREVLLEMYWIGDDIVGHAFLSALTDAANRGVRVLVVFDAVGSLAIGLPFFTPLVQHGGLVREYNAITPWNLGVLEVRDHRKLLVVDGERAITGGVNLAKQWAPIETGGDGWRDDMIEVLGQTAAELRTFFYGTWRRLTRERSPVGLSPIPRTSTRRVSVLSSRNRRHRIHRAYIRRIRSAQHSVEIANPYFVPDFLVMRALLAARRHGVRVRIMVPERSDIPLLRHAQNGLLERLLRRGVEIYALPGPMMHQKTAIIDDAWVTIGSYNLDERSLRKNLELNVAVEDAAFAAYVRERSFDEDVKTAHRIVLANFSERGIVTRATEQLALVFRRLL